MQFHFVALDKIEASHPNPPVVQVSQPQNRSSSHSTITDEEVAEGDAYTATITGGPSPTMLYKENPAAVVNIAPCEGEKPMRAKFPGNGGFNAPRPKKLTPCKYFNQHILDKDGRLHFHCPVNHRE